MPSAPVDRRFPRALAAKALLYGRTLATLKPSQAFGRVAYRMRRPRVSLTAAPERRALAAVWRAGCRRATSMVGDQTFIFLNQQHTLDRLAFWNAPDIDKLWLYNLHYFDDLNAGGAAKRRDWHMALIEQWIADNPVGHGIGWEPYPLSLRIVNWIKFALAGATLSERAVQSLAIQVRYLAQRLEFHILGNHLLANAKALIFAGSYFTGSESDAWLEAGLHILGRQVREQILADGAHFELSPMYHAIILEDFLDLQNVACAYGMDRQFPDLPIVAMLRWLAAMCHPDGGISFFNDAAFGIAPSLAELDSYARRLDLPVGDVTPAEKLQLTPSGYVRLRKGAGLLLIDAAAVGPSYLPAHAHADTLSFEFSLAGQRFFVNGGTSRYGISLKRHLERSTAAHNTLVIDDENSSEVWSSFRVARRARAFLDEVSTTDSGALRVTAHHDGYRRLPGRNVHHRSWTLHKTGLEIDDRITGRFTRAELFFHLHPDVEVELVDDATAIMIIAGKAQVRLGISGGQLRCEPDVWHPAFGVEIPSQRLVVLVERYSLISRIEWTLLF